MNNNSKKVFDVFDRVIATSLGVTVDEYIEKIERLDEDTRADIILKIMSDDSEEMEEGIKLFNDLM